MCSPRIPLSAWGGGESCSMARSASNNLRLLYMRQIKRWLGQWVWVNQLLIKELIRCDVPGITNTFNVRYCPFLFVDPSSHIGRASVYLQSEGPSRYPAYVHASPYGLAYSQSKVAHSSSLLSHGSHNIWLATSLDSYNGIKIKYDLITNFWA